MTPEQMALRDAMHQAERFEVNWLAILAVIILCVVANWLSNSRWFWRWLERWAGPIRRKRRKQALAERTATMRGVDGGAGTRD